MILYYVIAFFQVVFCVALVGLILLHSGKGGGLSSSLGGGIGGTFSGTTIMEKNLTRLTLIIMGLFVLTNVALFFLT
jgi:preprotein translocase subunit SecG